MKYLDQLNEENIPSTGEGTENIEMFDEDLCERLITYDASPNTKISKEKKTSLCN